MAAEHGQSAKLRGLEHGELDEEFFDQMDVAFV